MANELDSVIQKIAELSATVKEHVTDRATIDYDKLASEVMKLQEQSIQARNDKQPVRKGEEAGFGVENNDRVKGGKFDGQRLDDVLMTDWILSKAGKEQGTRVRPSSPELKGVVNKALTATGSLTGDDYVPTGMAASLWNDVFIQARVVGQFATVPMPTDPFDLPLGWGNPTWRKGTQNTAATASDPATAKVTLTSTENLCEINWSYDLDEDAVIAVMPTLREMLARSAAEQVDKFMMNADATDAGTGNINLDDADPDADSYYLSNGQDGLRHQIIVDKATQATDINTTLTDALVVAGIAKLGDYGLDVERLVLFTNPKNYLTMLGLTNVQTYDKIGPSATMVTGQLANYRGIPVVPTGSIALAEDDGKVSTTAGNNDEGTIVVVHRDMWKVGFRRQLQIELWRDIQKRMLVMVTSFRIAVAARGTRSTATHTAGLFGIA